MNFTRLLKLCALKKMGESATGKTFPELICFECRKRSSQAKLDNFPLTARLIIKLVRECEAREKFIRSSELENGSFLYKIYKSRVCMSTFSKMLNVRVGGKKNRQSSLPVCFFYGFVGQN